MVESGPAGKAWVIWAWNKELPGRKNFAIPERNGGRL